MQRSSSSTRIRLVRRLDGQHPRRLAKEAAGIKPMIDTEGVLANFERGHSRLESRQAFGKIIVHQSA
jgi:hypothetical protein